MYDRVTYMQYFKSNCNNLQSWGQNESVPPPKLVANTQLSKVINKSRLMSHAILHNNLQELRQHGLFYSFTPPFASNIQNKALFKHLKKSDKGT